ncbi:hypothetical protein QOZ80_6BG0489800 [Eleusine coracana subsp. coracana]|nr:hypothetical protein QOZ80_6BG0489800 [Eleusine coracana subsp. coracana]
MGAVLTMEPLVPVAAFELHLHPVSVACVLLTVAALFRRVLADRELLRSRHSWLHEALVAAAAELRLHPAIVGTVLFAVAALFNLAILAVNSLVARWPADGEHGTVVRCSTASAAAAPTLHASRPQFPHFAVLCFAMGTALLAEPLVEAATDLGVHSGVVACFVLAVTTLFSWAILSINFRVARRAAEHDRVKLLRPAAQAASAVRAPNAAHLAFLVLAALVSASWFLEPFAAAAEHCLPKAVIVIFVLLFTGLFNVSIRLFRSFFLLSAPSSGAAAALGQGVGAITAGVMGVGIAVTTYLIGSVYYVYSPART